MSADDARTRARHRFQNAARKYDQARDPVRLLELIITGHELSVWDQGFRDLFVKALDGRRPGFGERLLFLSELVDE